jgi:hypothetical protein
MLQKYIQKKEYYLNRDKRYWKEENNCFTLILKRKSYFRICTDTKLEMDELAIGWSQNIFMETNLKM